MNDRFASYVTSTAFSLSLSQSMIAVLDHMRRSEDPIGFDYSNNFLSPWRSLERRGLVYFYGEKDGNIFRNGNWKEKAWHVTDAGKLVTKLLIEAGLLEKLKEKKKAA